MKLSRLWNMIHATRLPAATFRFRMCQMRGGRSIIQAKGASTARAIPAGISVLVVGSTLCATTLGVGIEEFILADTGEIAKTNQTRIGISCMSVL